MFTCLFCVNLIDVKVKLGDGGWLLVLFNVSDTMGAVNFNVVSGFLNMCKSSSQNFLS